MPMLNCKVTRHDGVKITPELYDAWRTLYDNLPDASLFHHPDWVISWYRAFGSDKRLILFSIQHNDQILGIAPFILSNIRRGPDFFTHHYQQPEDLALLRYHPRTWFRVRQLSPAVNLQSGNVRGGWLCAKGFDDSVLSALFEHLAGWRGWDMLHLPSIKSEQIPALEHVAARGGLSLLSRYCHHLYGFSPEPWDRYYAGRSKRFRKSYRGIFNRLKGLGDYVLCASTARTEISDNLDDFFDLARRCWKQAPREEQSVFIPMNEQTESFYRDLCQHFIDRDQCQLYSLQLDGKMISGLLCLTDKHVSYALLTYYDPDYASISPGRFSIQAMIDWCGNHDIQWVDLNGNSKVILAFMDHGDSYDQVAIFRKSGYSRWLHSVAAVKYRWDQLRGEPAKSTAPTEEMADS